MPWLDRLARLRGTQPAKPAPDPETHEVIEERLQHLGGTEESMPIFVPPAEEMPPAAIEARPAEEGPAAEAPGKAAEEPADPGAESTGVATQQIPITSDLPTLPDTEAAAADGVITTVLVGIDVAEGENPEHVLDLMASLEELAAVIFRRGDVTYPAGPSEMLLVCPERSPDEVRDAIGRLQRASAPLGVVRAAIFSLHGDPRDSLPELQAALAVCRATGLKLVDKTLFQG